MSRRGKQPEVLPDWVKMQQKTFTRWFNKHLKKIGESITDLQEGLEDGLKVVKFVELVTGETIPKYNRRPRIRIQKIENLKIAIEKIQTSKKFEFTSIGPEDIVDKNLKLILGFVWTIIMKCSIEEISVEEMTAKEALLLWCKKQTQGYANVNVRNFTTSWKDGLAFAAIIHHNKPSAVDYNSLDPKNPADNLETAFEAANQLGIDRFLDVEDMLTEIPDEKAVMTYLAEYFQYFSSGQKQQNAARRIGKLMDFTKTNDELKADYETLGEELMKWIVDKTKDLQNHDFGNTKEEIEKLIDEFDDYKKNEKPPKVTDKSNLESLYNTIARKLEANNRPPFIPKGPTIENIQGKWEELENAEKERDRLLRDELARQERLEALLANFNNKVKKLKKFYQDKKNQLTSPHEVSTLIAANQELKQLDAYDDEYDRSKPRLEEVMVIGNKIINENYKDKDEIQNKMDELTGNWDELKDLAEKLRKKLEEDKKREELKEDLRKKWAKKAKNYNRWVKNTCDDVSVYEFGDTLEAVQKYKEPMDNNSQEAKKKSEKKLDKLKDIWKKMEDLDVKDNRYSAIKMENIEDFNKNLNDELAKRDEAYEKELQRQIEMDKKRKEFADAAEDFLKYLEKHVEEINSLTGEPEPLIEAIKGVHQEGNPSKEELEKVAKIDAEMKKMGIADNKYTKHTLPSLTAKRNKDVDVHVKDYISSLEEESKQKKYYEDEAKKWMKEVNDIIEKLKEREFDNTLEGAIAKDSEFIEYMSTQHPEKSAQKVGLLTLSDNINSYMKSLPYHRPEFEHPEGLSPKDLNDKWDELVDVENSRKEDIDNELTRQEKCHEIQTKFHEEAGKLEKWVDKQEKYLQTEEDVHTIHLAQTQMNKLENFKKDLDHSEKQIDKLKDMAKELKELNYHKIDEVEDRMDKLKEHWKSLFGLHDIKKKRLEDVLEKMDKKCKEFADAAEEFLKYLEKHVEEINSLTGEPEPLIEAIKEVYQEGNPSKEELAKVAAIDKELREMGIVDNKYTKHTLSSLTAKRNQDVDVYVKKYISAMEEESKQKKYYEDEAKKWMQEVNDIIEKLKEREFDNTLEGAIAKDSEFIEYMRTQHSEKSAQKVGLLTLSDNINSYMKLLPYNRPEFEHPEGLSPKDLNGKWDELIKIENSRKEDIANELSRQQKCHEIQTKFHEEAGKMEEWVDKQEKYLQTEEDVHTIHLAQTQMNKLENFKKDLDNSEKQIDKLKDMAKKLKELNYHKIDEVEDRMDKLKEHWKSLFGLHDIKKKRLEDVLEKMDKKCKEFADAAEEFLKYLEKHVEEINSLTGEPEPLIEAIKEVHQEGNPSKEELAKVEAIDKELREMGIVDNKYTTSSLSSLTAKRNQDVDVYVKKYISAMNEELRQKKYYGEQATKWMQEVNDIIEKLKEREFDNTLEGAIAKNSEFIEYMSTQHSEKSAQKVGLLTLSNNINGYMKLLPYNRPEFAHPEGLSPKDLNDKWDELIDVEEARKKDINTELTRQQNCHETQKKFHDEAGKLEKWVDKQEKYLQTEEDVHAIHLAQTQMNKLENFKKDLDHSEKQIDKLKDMAKKLKELNYHKIDEVEDRMNKLEEHWKSLFGLHDIKKKRLEDALDKMDKKRKEFADAAEEFLKYLEKHVEEINSLTGEPEPLIEAIKEVHQEGNPSKEELAKVAAIDKELREMGIADNKYTKHTLSSLTAKRNQDVDVYVKKYISAMEEELKEKNSYKEQATKWMQEVNDIIEKLKEREFDNTLEGAIAKNSEFIEYMSTQHSEKSAQKVGLLTLSNNINKYMKSLPYHRPEFAHPEGLSPKDLNEKWDELIKIEKSRKEDIANELSRQQKCDEIQKKFHDEAGKMEEWVDKQEKYLQTEEDVHTIHLAQTQMNKLENFKKDLDNSEKQIDKLKDMAKKLKELNYHKIDEVEDRMDKLKEHWKSLFGLHDTKKERLETSSERMDKKRKEFADAAEEFLKYLEKHVEEINALTGEPEPLIEAIKEVHQEGNPSKAELEKVAEIDAEMKKMGIADNKYTKHTLPSLSAKRNQDVDVYVEDYISAMKEELRQKKDYEEEAKKWMQEVNDIIEKLKEREFDNTLEGAIAKNSEFIEYKSTQHSEKSAQKLSLFNRSDNINGYMKSLPYHRPEFAHPEGLSPKDLDEKWKELLEVEEERKKDIDTELTRQEKCDDIKKKFHDEAGKLEKWVDKQEKYLKTEEDIHKFRAAQTQTNKLESFKKDLDHSEKQIKKLKERAKKLKELNYHKIDEVEDRMNKLEEHWKSLFGLHDIKKKRLEDALEKMDEKRKEFADAAEEFLKYLEKHVEEINALTGEPEPLIEAINEIYQEGNPSKEELAKVEAIDNELKDHGIADNKYTKHTLPSLTAKRKQDVDVYVEEYISAMKEELRQKKDYEEQAKKWMDEVNGMIEKLKEREFDNTLEGAIAKNSELTEFMSTQHSEKSAQKSSLFNRSDNINGYMKSLPYHRPEFAHPEGLSPKDLDEKWKELLEVEEARKKDINTELVRQEKCDDIQKKFHERAAKMEKWNEKQEKYLKTEEDIQTLRAAQIQLRKLDNFKKDLDYSEKQVDQLKEMAKDLKELNYHKIDEVEDRMNKLEEHWKSLFELHDTKKNSLEESLKLEENKDALRKEFAEKAGAYRLWCSKSIAECRDAHFGSSLEEVQNFKEVLESKNKEMTTKSEESKTELENLSNQLTELKVADNRYTRLTIEDVKSSHNDLMEAIQNRTNAYETELARQQAMEDKRIEFAKHADEFVKFLDQKKQQLDQVQGEPEEKIEEVKKIYNEGTDANEMFEKLVQIDDEAKSMEIVQNKHTEFDIQILTTKKKWYDNYVKNLLASIEEEKKMKERAAQLQKEWEEQRRKEEMIQEYASKSQSLNTWLDIAHEKTTDPITSTTPKDNEELTKDFHDFFKNKDDKEKDYEELQELAKKMTEANITNFSGLPIETVTERWNEIDQLIDERKKDLEKDKKKQEKHEDKRKKFAEKANHFNEFLEKTKKSITEVTGSPSEQLDKIKKYHSELLKKEDNLEELISLGANLEKHHILNNPYTTFTAQSSKQAYEELVNYSNKLQETITNTILESQGKKVTDQQMKEFREVFDHFAKTNGALDKLSFSGCLKGLGEHMTDGEIAKVFDSFETDKSGKMEFDEFVRFMASRTVDMDTKEQILESFRDLSKNPPVITESEMRDYFPQEQVDYFKQHMTPQGEGYNYESWTDEAFNR